MAHDRVTIKAEKRKIVGKQVKALRREGKLPAVIYGRHISKPVAIQMDAHSTSLQLAKLTGSSLIVLDVDGEKHNVIVRERVKDVIYGRLIHVDFLAVSMREKLRTQVGITLTGEAPVLKLFECVVNQNLHSLDIECLPADMPEVIEVDISGIDALDSTIKVADLKLDDAITVHADPEDVIVSVGIVAEEPEPVEGEEELPEGERIGEAEEEAEQEEESEA
jgi:large subunit ribosomal protein L25